MMNFLNKFKKKEIQEYPNSVYEKPLVSVSVLTFQHKNYIKECLEGILMQKTRFPIEILLGEDDSTDGTREICLKYAKNHPDKIRLFLHHHDNKIKINGNLTGRFNVIYNYFSARGKYIALCEGDDYWTDPLKLQKQVDFLEENNGFSGCFHDTLIFNENEKNPELKPWRHYEKEVFYLKDMISYTSLFHTSSFMFRKASLNIPHWLYKVQSGDMALFVIIGTKGPLFRLDESMSVYRKNPYGITNFIEIVEYHSNRIKLWSYFKEICPTAEISKVIEVINYHKNQERIHKRNNNKWYKLLAKMMKK